MSAITGFFHPQKNFLEQEGFYQAVLERMNQSLSHRGLDDSGTFLSSQIGLGHTHLAVHEKTSSQPTYRQIGHDTYVLAMDGELYNREELLHELEEKHLYTGNQSDGDILLTGFLEYGPSFIEKVNGVFAIAFYQEKDQSLMLFRDRFGVKPLFYAVLDGTLLFGSEIKAILSYPGMEARVDTDGLNQIFSIGPARTPGCGVYQNIKEVLPAHFLVRQGMNLKQKRYWNLSSHPHTDSYEDTVACTSALLQDAVRRQFTSDAPICAFLSGGVDSSLVSSICANELRKKNRRLVTYSFDFKDSQKYFQSNAFQPSLDRPFVEKMVEFLGSEHHFLECDSKMQADALYDSVKAHDLPAMADVDSSLLVFCSQVAKNHTIAMTGECADEVFGGYPWFHKAECLNADTFPWTMDLNPRKAMLADDFAESLHMEDYVAKTYENAIRHVPLSESDTPAQKKLRILSYLNLYWFMQTLLNRMDRAAGYSGMAARVPFADYRLVEYVWNIPWEMKAKDGIVKGLLRDSGRGLLPDEILWRRKSPYPKTYDTSYEKLLCERLHDVLHTASSPILPFLDTEKVTQFLESPSDYGKPWYGQLMAAPQMIAYMIQVNAWMKEYHVKLV